MNPLRKAKLTLQVAGFLAAAEDLANQEQEAQTPLERKQLMKAFLKKYGPVLLSVGGTLAAAAVPALKDVVKSHPLWAAALNSALLFGHAAAPSIFK